MMQGMGNMMGACLGGMGGMMTFVGAFWIAVTVGIVYVARRGGHGPELTPAASPVGGAGDTALAILRDRFARGEFDRAEYEERRRMLTRDEARWP